MTFEKSPISVLNSTFMSIGSDMSTCYVKPQKGQEWQYCRQVLFFLMKNKCCNYYSWSSWIL